MNTPRASGKLWKSIFIVIMLLGVYATFIRFVKGLGAATNLSDEFPWGLWIGFDILVGVGLAAGGFIIAATVHIFQIEKYRPISRSAILTAFLGYLLVIVALMFDLGRPYRIWHPLVMGNPHSVMFEVAICVMLYTTVLAFEFSPIILRKFGLKAPLRVIRAVYIPLVILGVLLSTLHQSSLGTLYVIVPDKLHGLWYSPLLPVFFFLSAIAGGLAMTIFESFLSFRAFGKRLETELLEGIARVIVVVLAVLFIWKFQNLYDRGNLHLAFEVTQESVMFWGELFLGVALPMVLFMFPRVRTSQSGLLLGGLLTVMGFILNRLNVAITGLAASSGVNYVPSWMEFTITVAIVAVGFALFGFAVRHLDIFPEEPVSPADPIVPSAPRPAFAGRTLVALWAVLIAGFLMLGFTNRRDSAGPSDAEAQASSTIPTANIPQGILIDDFVLPKHEDSPGPVTFSHETHVDWDAPDCATCHAGTFRILAAGPAWPEQPQASEFHEPLYCGKCHNGDDAFDVDDDCESCHEE